jgi:hypothetical protein
VRRGRRHEANRAVQALAVVPAIFALRANSVAARLRCFIGVSRASRTKAFVLARGEELHSFPKAPIQDFS